MKNLTEKHIHDNYSNFLKVYTDASKLEHRVGIGIYEEKNGTKISLRVNDHLAITSGELIAIKKVLENTLAYPTHIEKSICICTDSLGACQAISSGDIKNSARPDILADITSLHERIIQTGINIKILWIPSHVGIIGNEIADKCANEGRVKEMIDINVKLGYSEMVSLASLSINKNIYQSEYSLNTHPTVVKFRKTFPEIKNKISLDKNLYLLNRIRARADRINHFNEDIYCRICRARLNSKHAIKYCSLFTKEREAVIKEMRSENLKLKIKNIGKTGLKTNTKRAIMTLLQTIDGVFKI